MDARSRSRTTAGFTLVEVLVVLVIGSLVLAAVYEVMISQSWAFGRQREIADVQNSLRSAAALLASDIRVVAPEDVYAMGDSSITLRSYTASGVVCAVHPGLRRLALTETNGSFDATAEDSLLVLATGGSGLQDDVWRVLRATSVGSGPSLGLDTCAWGDVPDVALALAGAGPLSALQISVGGPVLAFRRVRYGLYEESGRWWLGRRVGSADWEMLTGPLLAPAEGGLEFHYTDAVGNTAVAPQLIAAVKVVIRAESYAAAGSAGGLQHVRDTVAMRISLRNASSQ